MTITGQLKTWLHANAGAVNPDSAVSDDYWTRKAAEAIEAGTLSHGQIREWSDAHKKGIIDSVAEKVADKLRGSTSTQQTKGFQVNANDIHNAAGAGGTTINVKRPSERYRDARVEARNKHGQTVKYMGSPICEPTEKQLALAGTWFKHTVSSNNRFAQVLSKHGFNVPCLNEHEKCLLAEIVETERFAGCVSGDKWTDGATLKELNIDTKGILADALSGGTNLVPYDFSEIPVLTALLNGELFPYITLLPTNSNQVRTPKPANPTMTWGSAEGTAIGLFNTDSMIDTLTDDVEVVSAAIEWGKDMEQDSPVAIGSIIMGQLGEVFLQEMDRVIVEGNGTTEPQGLLNASGTATVSADNTGSGPPTLDDYFSLIQSVGKQYRRSDLNPMFVSNDTSYWRSRNIKVDPATPSTDQRPVFGLESANSYVTCDFKHAINNSLTNRQIAFFIAKRYWMWRRSGLEFSLTDEGESLKRRNMVLLIARARFAGQLVAGDSAAIMTDAQS